MLPNRAPELYRGPVTRQSSAARSYFLFALIIFAGSFLLFVVQPLIARQALPLLGGAPAVWNSAMVVFQLLLLGGYAYAHLLTRLTVRRQALVHAVLLGGAALTLPIGLTDRNGFAAASPVLGVPLLFAASIGPVFLLLSAQASLLQRWYADGPGGRNPYRLYAVSNLGSFAGLAAYPLLIEPAMPLSAQRWAWSAGFLGVAFAIAFIVFDRRKAVQPDTGPASESAPIPLTRKLLWIVLAAVPSGLILSTTTLLTTDLMAMPLLWVIPLALYLLSFPVAFSDHGLWASVLSKLAPVLLVLIGSLAMVSGGRIGLFIAIGMLGLFFVLSVALHNRLYALRPPENRLTLFYLFVAIGGVTGGAFVAIVAPLLFDWIYEHVILLLAAALLLPAGRLVPLPRTLAKSRVAGLAAMAVALGLCVWTIRAVQSEQWATVLPLALGLMAIPILLIGARWAFAATFALLLLAFNGVAMVESSMSGERSRSYFGVYTVERAEDGTMRRLTHGTTMHGEQFLDPARRLQPTAYYGPTSGVGIALAAAPDDARIGIVGLGVGTLACYRKPGQEWTFFEIDPVVVQYSRNATFTFVQDCAPDARMVIGDARVELGSEPSGGYDALVLDAFSSDAIPLHLLTAEAFDTYDRVLAEDGVLLAHISNRFLDLAPAIAAIAREKGWATARRYDLESGDAGSATSEWIALARSPSRVEELRSSSPAEWDPMPAPTAPVITDENASLLSLLRM